MKRFLLITFLFLFVLGSTFGQNKDAVLGKWLSEHGNGQIEIHKQGAKYFGKLVWLKNSTEVEDKSITDINNPSKELQSKPVIGLEVLKNFTYKGDGVWSDGTVYDPKSGKTYECKMSMGSSDKLDIRGYMGISLIGKTETWTRVD